MAQKLTCMLSWVTAHLAGHKQPIAKLDSLRHHLWSKALV